MPKETDAERLARLQELQRKIIEDIGNKNGGRGDPDDGPIQQPKS